MNRYPLSWPDGWRRMPAAKRKRAMFGKSERQYSTDRAHSWNRKRELTVADAIHRVLSELQMFGVLEGDSIISTNLAVRLDGLPRSGQAEPDDPGVAVYWERPADKGTKVMAIDIYDRVADNLAAIAATLEAMRAIERHGGAVILERAFTGFTALPSPDQIAGRGWREIFGVGSLPATLADVEAVYKALRSRHHPDKGGDPAMFDAVQKAFEQAREELGRAK